LTVSKATIDNLRKLIQPLSKGPRRVTGYVVRSGVVNRNFGLGVSSKFGAIEAAVPSWNRSVSASLQPFKTQATTPAVFVAQRLPENHI
jgi:hypothetical protein